MGYSTTFDGVLKLTQPLSPGAYLKLKSILQEDVRDHPEWQHHIDHTRYLSYIDLYLTEDGIKWDGSIKTCNMVDLINLVIKIMRECYPEFGLSGILEAQGEESDDRYHIVIGKDGMAFKEPLDANSTNLSNEVKELITIALNDSINIVEGNKFTISSMDMVTTCTGCGQTVYWRCEEKPFPHLANCLFLKKLEAIAYLKRMCE